MFSVSHGGSNPIFDRKNVHKIEGFGSGSSAGAQMSSHSVCNFTFIINFLHMMSVAKIFKIYALKAYTPGSVMVKIG